MTKKRIASLIKILLYSRKVRYILHKDYG